MKINYLFVDKQKLKNVFTQGIFNKLNKKLNLYKLGKN